MSVDLVIGCAFAACAVVLLVIAFRRLRSGVWPRAPYRPFVFAAWASSGGAISNLFPSIFHTVSGNVAFFTVGLIILAWAQYGDRNARHNAGKQASGVRQ